MHLLAKRREKDRRTDIYKERIYRNAQDKNDRSRSRRDFIEYEERVDGVYKRDSHACDRKRCDDTDRDRKTLYGDPGRIKRISGDALRPDIQRREDHRPGENERHGGKGVLTEHLLPLEDAKKALEILRKYDTLQEVYFDGQGYAEADKLEEVQRYHHSPHMQEYVRKSRICVSELDEIIAQENRAMDKVQGLFADMKEREQAWQELKQFDSLELVGSLKYNIEINAAGVNKGKGLLELGEILGISREEIMAFGDGDNDIAMLREVGFGVAMENADEEVKAVADYVTGSNDEDGVAKAIARFVLGETVQ